MKPSEAGELVLFVLSAYPTQRQRMLPQDATAMQAAYAAALADVDADEARQAAIRLMRTSRFIPTIAEVREGVGIVRSGERRHGIDAWGDVIEMRKFRDREQADQVDQLALQVCRSFGWIEWRTLWRGIEIEQWHVVSGENEAADRARFAEAYDKLAAAGRREAQAAPGAMLPPGGQAAAAQLDNIATGLAAKLNSGAR